MTKESQAVEPETSVRALLLEACGQFAELLSSHEVVAAWGEPSALAEYSVGALAGHVASSVGAVMRYLGDDVGGPTVSTGAYYAAVPAPADAPDLHAGIRGRGAALAEAGPLRVHEDFVSLVAALRTGLVGQPAERTITVAGGMRMTLDDYLETRLVEVVAHQDDICASVGADCTPAPGAVALAIDHLIAVAKHRHGDLAILRALVREERDLVRALRVL